MLVGYEWQYCKGTRADGEPCQRKCPQGKTYCSQSHADGSTTVTVQKGAVGPGYRQVKNKVCIGFKKNGDRCKRVCPAGYTECWEHKNGKIIKTRTRGAKGPSNVVYVLSDDEDITEEMSEMMIDEEEELNEKQPLKKGQCLCFNDDGKRCKRNVTYGNLYYCYEHAQGPCETGKKGDYLMAQRSGSNPKHVNGGHSEKCCAGGIVNGKCTYEVCDENYEVDPVKQQKAMASAKRAGRQDIVEKIKNDLGQCQKCGETYVIEVTQLTPSKFRTCKGKGKNQVCTTTDE